MVDVKVLIYNCKRCGKEDLDIDDLAFNNKSFFGCKSCYKKYRKSICKKYNDDPERKLQISNYYREKRHGLNEGEFNKRRELQLNGCAICKQEFGESRNIYIDHDHQTNKIRNLLCPRCNTILGLVNDSEKLLFAFLEYLKRHEEKIA